MGARLRLGAFGWGTHTPRSGDPARVAKRRPCVVVMQRGDVFVVVFGRSQPRPGTQPVTISELSEVGRRLGLRVPTHFQRALELAPKDLDPRGFFATAAGDEDDPDVVLDHDLWLRLRGLAERR